MTGQTCLTALPEEVRTVHIDSVGADGEALLRPVHTVRPASGTRGAVTLVHHRTGIDGFVEGVARRCLDAGLAVVVPDFFHGIAPHPDPEVRKAALRDDTLLSDLRQCASLTSDLADGRAPGILGFCMGGRIALLAVAAGLPYARACCFYGGAPRTSWGPGPSPIDRIGAGTRTVRSPLDIQFHRGTRDDYPSAADADALTTAVEDAGGQLQLCTYAGAAHAFMDPGRADCYHPEAAARAWASAAAFLVGVPESVTAQTGETV
ncbi:dienelactone hydrolase family protein [Streptomyces sp. Agncl-13]|uniref:dienelactone hydrolase family protein n=1 Tax=Streptomyces sp. Agncl-13 TaxID=3400628 RepID=UPI003A89923A